MSPELQAGFIGAVVAIFIASIAGFIAWGKFSQKVEQVMASCEKNAHDNETLRKEFHEHKSDMRVHIDPIRDQRSYQEMRERWERIEDKVDKVIQNQQHRRT